MQVSKVCTGCGVEKPLDLFYRNKNHADGRAYYCKRCASSKARENRGEVKEFVEAYKLEHGCVDCGYNEYACALDLDHLPQYEKSFTIANQMHMKLDTIKAEISKCEVVCSNCHRVRTHKRALERVQNL